MKKISKICLIIIGLCIMLDIGLNIGKNKTAEEIKSKRQEQVQQVLKADLNNVYQSPTREIIYFEPLEKWENGDRYKILLDREDDGVKYMAYFEGDKLVTIYDVTEGKEKEELFRVD